MRLEKIQAYMKGKGMEYDYVEDNDCGSITFVHRGLTYHIWEFPEPERGAESNILSCGRSVDYEGNYEDQLIDIMRTW